MLRPVGASKSKSISQSPLLGLLLVTLHLVADLEVSPILEADAAFGALAHFHDVLFDVSERGKGSCRKRLVSRCGKRGAVGMAERAVLCSNEARPRKDRV